MNGYRQCAKPGVQLDLLPAVVHVTGGLFVGHLTLITGTARSFPAVPARTPNPLGDNHSIPAMLDPLRYTIVWIAPLEIEARAACCLLDRKHRGSFPMQRGNDYVFQAGEMCGHNVVIATLPPGQEYETGSAAALAAQVKSFFPNFWFGLLVGGAEDVKTKITIYGKDLEDGGRRSFRRWAKLRFLGGDIDDSTNQLAIYKSSFAIALADANL